MTYSLFDCVSPLDFRYYGPATGLRQMLDPYVTAAGRVGSEAMVEAAAVRVLARRGVCSEAIAQEVADAAEAVTADEVAAEEARIHHNIRALVNVFRGKVSDEARPYVHLCLTSFDVVDTATAWRLQQAARKAVLPTLADLQRALISLARREAGQVQMGRTHGQHAVPITFGFSLVGFISRLQGRMEAIATAAEGLCGKLSGAVGAYNASSLFFDDPEQFEAEVLAELGLKPSPSSTQIAEPEAVADYMHALVSTFGVLADLADDMRQLQRTEIAEVGERFEADQVGSSTMPHKRNPWNFENVKSMWKTFVPRMGTVYADQLSEHQRDLTNSASSRFNPELLVALVSSVKRQTRIMAKLVTDVQRMEQNFAMTAGMVAAEPAYILLASLGHPDAHEAMRKLTLQAQASGRPLWDLLSEAPELAPYLERLTDQQIAMLRNPHSYTGVAEKKTLKLCDECSERLDALMKQID